MTPDITTLISQIRAWQAAYEQSVAESPTYSSDERRAKVKLLNAAAQAVTGSTHSDAALAAFVALANEVERLNLECLSLATTGYSADTFYDALGDAADDLVGTDEQESE